MRRLVSIILILLGLISCGDGGTATRSLDWNSGFGDTRQRVYIYNQTGEYLGFRLFDFEANMVWPEGYEKDICWQFSDGDLKYIDITCPLGDSICLGANNSGNEFKWGVGLYAQSPDNHDLCYVCDGEDKIAFFY